MRENKRKSRKKGRKNKEDKNCAEIARACSSAARNTAQRAIGIAGCRTANDNDDGISIMHDAPSIQQKRSVHAGDIDPFGRGLARLGVAAAVRPRSLPGCAASGPREPL